MLTQNLAQDPLLGAELGAVGGARAGLYPHTQGGPSAVPGPRGGAGGGVGGQGAAPGVPQACGGRWW